MKAQDEQTDSLAKLVKDIFVQKGMFVAKYVAKLVLPILLGLVLLVSVVAIPVVAIVGTIGCIERNTTKVSSIKAYLMRSLSGLC